MPVRISRKRTHSGSIKTSAAGRSLMKYMGGPNPPKRDLSFPQGLQIFRFHCASGISAQDVTKADLLSMLVSGISANANTPVRLLHSLRLKYVEAWSPPAVAGSAPQQLAITWRGTTTGDRVMDDSNVANTASHIKTFTPKSTDATDWIFEGVTEGIAAFTISCTTGTIVDVGCYCTTTGSAVDGHTLSSSTAATTNYAFYFRPLIANLNPMTALGVII